jgi:hypothetical protein
MMFSDLPMMLKRQVIQVEMIQGRRSPRLSRISYLCGFPEAYVMVEVMKQQGWTELEHVTTIPLDESKYLCLIRDDGMYLGFPMMMHIRKLKAFLRYYKRRSRGCTFPHNEYDVLEYTKRFFNEYCPSNLYTKDESTSRLLSTSMAKAAPQPYSIQGTSLTVQAI